MSTMILSSDSILQVIVCKLLNHISCFDLDWQGLMPNSTHKNTLTKQLLRSMKDYDQAK